MDAKRGRWKRSRGSARKKKGMDNPIGGKKKKKRGVSSIRTKASFPARAGFYDETAREKGKITTSGQEEKKESPAKTGYEKKDHDIVPRGKKRIF